MADEETGDLSSQADGVKKVSEGDRQIEYRSAEELAALDDREIAKEAVKKPHRGLWFTQLRPPSCG